MDRVRYLIGVATLVLAIAGGAYLVNLLSDEDKSLYFRLRVEFLNVEGLLPGADVKYRGVQVGSVREVALRDDGRKGIAVLALNPGTETLACTNSKFWIVTPRFGGITSGASGLETLVRDAYVSFVTPQPAGAQLANGSSVAGWERPFVDPDDELLPAPRRGDLVMNLLIPENHGLVPGSEVRFRGVQTGEVSHVSLANDGSHVRLELRIDRRFRPTVTDETVFWVARPRLSGGIVGGVAIDDVGALLSPFVGYHTENGQGQPVSDGFLVAAEPYRPTLELPKVSTAGLELPTPAPHVGESAQLVRVIYEATEEDWFSADDDIRREGTGVLFADGEGRLLVLTARSGCDAAYFERDFFGAEPDVKAESVTVVLMDGTVVRALRTWVAPDGTDLALLTLEATSEQRDGIVLSAAGMFSFAGVDESGQVLWSLDSDRRVVEAPAPAGEYDPSFRGAPVVQGGQIVGVYGQATGTDESPAVAPASVVPESLRPRS